MKMRIDIIIPIWNLLDATTECIDSLERHTEHLYRLILIDNGSEPETANYLKGLKDRFTDAILLRNETNLGFVKAANQGIGVSESEYICILNNDTILTKGWLGELVSIMDREPSIGALNPSSNTSGQFPRNRNIDEYASTLKVYKGTVQELYTCRGFCMLIRREIIDKLGFLDEIYHMGYFDDTDYCKRIQNLGYKTARAKTSYVYHKENKSFAQLRDNKDLFNKNEEIFFSRWGRHVRVGYFVNELNDSTLKDKINRIAIDVARDGHQILIFLRRGLFWPVKLDHFDIRKHDVNRSFFGMISLYKILKRKKKKKLEILLTDNRLYGSFLKGLHPLHKADVIIKPQLEALLDLLKKKSKTRI